jgi:hypothetical protein
VKIRQVAFYLDRRKAKTDKRSPFEAQLSTAGLTPHSRHTVTAKVSLRQKPRGRPAKRLKTTLKTTIDVC